MLKRSLNVNIMTVLKREPRSFLEFAVGVLSRLLA
jgi:hypothetical protein